MAGKRSHTFTRHIKYTNRLVAYFDILGWKEIIDASLADPQRLRAIEEALSAGRELKQAFVDEDWVTVTQFSDHVVLSVPGNFEDGQALLDLVSTACVRLLRQAILVRGGIAYGPLVHRSDVVYGPALVEAYILESTMAVYPRIVVGDSTRQLFRQIEMYKSYTKRGEDGVCFLDFVRVHGIDRARSACQAYLAEFGEPGSQRRLERLPPKARSKVEWAVSYVRSSLGT